MILTNPIYINLQTELNNKMKTLSNQLYNCSLLLYKGIPQNQYTNLQYQVAEIDYNYVPSYYKFNNFLSEGQISSIIQYYTNQANSVIKFIDTNFLTTLLQDTINNINTSIATLNNFASSLYNNEQVNMYQFIIDKPMSLRKAMIINGIDLSNMDLIILYNIGRIQTVQYLPAGFSLTLVRT